MGILRNGYSSSYFSINSILATDLQLSCRSQIRIPKFGFLAPEYFSEDLELGTELKLPFWAAQVLSRPSGPPPKPNFISILEPPTFFKDALWEVLEDDPKTADLRRFHAQYFEAGIFSSMLCNKDVVDLAEMLGEVFKQRVLCIGERSIADSETLEELELKLTEDWKEQLDKLEEWLLPFTKTVEVVQPSSPSRDLLEMKETEKLTNTELGEFELTPSMPIIGAGGTEAAGDGLTYTTDVRRDDFSDSTLTSLLNVSSLDKDLPEGFSSLAVDS